MSGMIGAAGGSAAGAGAGGGMGGMGQLMGMLPGLLGGQGGQPQGMQPPPPFQPMPGQMTGTIPGGPQQPPIDPELLRRIFQMSQR